jgi:hypothetical protein
LRPQILGSSRNPDYKYIVYHFILCIMVLAINITLMINFATWGRFS